ncbi:hypothetical protein A2331_00170 [Candidatus Falkowbacteria bacterium RIFOXYB2_FULL_34_18]|uniref:Carboxypeptidase regulatory-like domain-containing protein n=1 Tax=Candidatus Falkowbacteria bacterium RIFOXYD2_FULL_34_120 TaxID=1798007 RepID=A0A1F5TSK9_9BACT|nr:MAG: hypothetical protein A2331_00170 [Candidatus Falkowbacteria bacterium RIFOXYB2_FULL_34_18]OGF29761.1 MAG: hypothetical protein A2500_01180 [Candidatus Falkowbacteria bacterium RIFOXYC12_FULL_34_55]OGF37510.1 MAG: hypothetical protein A2466_00730 [Candidatus Falkowbacteria bacterium RIFOXYC2_FULL_34_220]OGF39220.1 MAG: hypothetical protein A2515_01240 [Candidatus Falkowbacteria bacterium RIFOXYD12_FULL_34_57]OGF41787.1 MAG: hypothetical protein A2531_05900 [Candidatus Falkowbacteria bact
MILTLGVYQLAIYSLNITSDNKFYVEAIEIANQKMEYIRNLPYDSVGTLTGFPAGEIPEYENLHRDGNFLIHTTIIYHDDEYDGTLASGTDLILNDYKIATIEVSWNGKFGAKSVTVFSKIISATEEMDIGAGLLKLIIVDANGDPVPNANIHIENNLLSPAYSQDFISDANGALYRALEPSFEGYEVTVTKAGYGTDQTYPRTINNPNPTKPHLSIISAVKTEESFSIDLLSNLTINTVTSDLPDNWQVNSDASGKAQINSRFDFDAAGFMYVVWQDYCCSADSKIHAQKYDTDGNAQWPNSGAPVDEIVGTANNTVLPDIQVDNYGNLYLAWNDDSVGNKESYLISLNSADGSDRWGGEKKINTTWNSDKSDPRITLLEKSGAATTSIVWVDNKNTDLDLFLHFYEQNGNPASTLPVRVNTNAVGDGSAQSEPSIISDNDDNTYIFWTDERNGDKDVYAAKISKSGNFLWSPDNKKINTDPGSANQYSPDTARDSSGYFYIVWTDERNGDKDIYAQKYDTDGNPEWADDLEISHDTDSANQEEPAIAIDATDNIYVVWTDERNGDKDIYAQKYDTDGNNLWTQDLRISLSFTSSNEYNPDVTINPNNNKPFATWQSDKNGDLDIFISEFNFYSTSTPAANVPIIIRGTKKIGELPNIIYEYDREYTIGATGKLNLQLEWDVPGYTITLKTASTSYNLLLHDPTPPVEILPDTNNIINLYLE